MATLPSNLSSLASDFGLTLKEALMDASSAAAAVQGQKMGGPSLASSKEGRVRIKRARSGSPWLE